MRVDPIVTPRYEQAPSTLAMQVVKIGSKPKRVSITNQCANVH